MLDDFYKYFDTFCKNNPAADLVEKYQYMTVKLYKEGGKDGDITWRVILRGANKNLILRKGDNKKDKCFSKNHLWL